MAFLKNNIFLAIIVLTLFTACKKDDDKKEDQTETNFFSAYDSKSFSMGFTTWPYDATQESVDNTYQFIGSHSDIYSEHIDSDIPWSAWINNTALPSKFTDDIDLRRSRRIPNIKLTVSVSLLNGSRNDLAYDVDGSIPSYNSINDQHIEDAYFKHLQYIANEFNPDYLIVSIEGNELLKNTPSKWAGYKLLMTNIRSRMKQAFPAIIIGESITLHNYYKVDVPDPSTFINDITDYANSMDRVGISFYPFFNGLASKTEFQEAFDFLHQQINKPIFFSETGHLSEDLKVDGYNLFIEGNETEQNDYLETLLVNAQEKNYEYVIWWTHRDYDALWNTFPDEVKDLGKLWIGTGIVNEDGAAKLSYPSWNLVLNKS